MKGLLLCLLVGCASASLYRPPPTRAPKVKPGTCPVDDTITTCDCRPEYIQCKGDYACPGAQKCCSWGCGCRTRCVNPAEKQKPVCRQPKVVGPCKALIPRYWYNKRTKRCERFDYGGCQGNKNNFETIKDCERRCKRRPTYLPGDRIRI
eukprot:XP_011433452.1 PREDICTED: eppin-like [Crassostrea gigas]